MRRWFATWTLAFVVGLIGVLALIRFAFYPLPFSGPLILLVIIVPLLLRSPHRGATGGALLLAASAVFLLYTWQGIERCAEIERSPQGSCEIYGTEDALSAIGLLAFTGLALSVGSFVAARRRSA